jgi:cobyrinic acid a,c-diamide synthase
LHFTFLFGGTVISTGIVIAGVHSGCGKTTISLGLMAALLRRGLRVAPFKVGPDFIDPGHHARITGTVSRNLDGWMLSRAYNEDCFRKHRQAADIAVVEGVMGLFDGYDGRSEAGSTAEIAKWLGLPVLLVVDARSMARSAAAVVQGFENFDQDLQFAGVVFNNLGSPRHSQYLQEALEGNVRMTYLGGLICDEGIRIPERHLGLVTRDDHPLAEEAISRLAGLVEENIDLDRLLACLPPTASAAVQNKAPAATRAGAVRVGVARDNAFCFYYQDNLDLLERSGAEIVFFSPLTDEALPQDMDGLYLGGGYPELFAGQLSANVPMRRLIREKSIAGMPIYAECGGFMYLCRNMSDMEGNAHAMADCFPFATKMQDRRRALGYREICLATDTIIGKADQRIRGHEFHYSLISSRFAEVDAVYRVEARAGIQKSTEGFRVHRTLGSYFHLHFGSQPAAAPSLVGACLQYRQERRHSA